MEHNKIFQNNKLQKAGGLIVRYEKGNLEILLLSSGKKSYSFPKGHLEPTETPEEGAVRECLEETGLKTRIVKKLPNLEYTNPETGDDIVVHLYEMKVLRGELTPESADTDLKWARLEDVENLFEYQNLKDYIKEARELLNENER